MTLQLSVKVTSWYITSKSEEISSGCTVNLLDRELHSGSRMTRFLEEWVFHVHQTVLSLPTDPHNLLLDLSGWFGQEFFSKSSEAIEHVLQNWACQIHFQFKDCIVSLCFIFNTVKIAVYIYMCDLVYNLLVKRLGNGSVRQIIGLFCLGYFLKVNEL